MDLGTLRPLSLPSSALPPSSLRLSSLRPSSLPPSSLLLPPCTRLSPHVAPPPCPPPPGDHEIPCICSSSPTHVTVCHSRNLLSGAICNFREHCSRALSVPRAWLLAHMRCLFREHAACAHCLFRAHAAREHCLLSFNVHVIASQLASLLADSRRHVSQPCSHLLHSHPPLQPCRAI